jgi:choline dehydrogenase
MVVERHRRSTTARAELDRFGIATASHLPGVGQNFQDHPIIGGGLWEAPAPLPPRNNAAEANILTKSPPELDTPDLHPPARKFRGNEAVR